MSSPILIYSGGTTSVGNTSPPVTSVVYGPTITALRDVPTSLQAVTTVGLDLGILIVFTVDDVIHFWMLESGNSDGSDPSASLQPADYDSGTNDVHWQRQNNNLFYDSLGNITALPNGQTANFENGLSVTADNLGIDKEVYLSCRTDGKTGSGTKLDPFDCGGASDDIKSGKLNAIWTTYNSNTNFYYAPCQSSNASDDYCAYGSRSNSIQTAFSGCKHYGTGRGSTRIRLYDTTTAGGGAANIFYASGRVPGFEVHDMTLDCDATSQPQWTTGSNRTIGGIQVLPDHVVIDNVEIIRFGTNSAGVECFPLYVTATTPSSGLFSDTLVQNNYVHSPVLGSSSAGCTPINVIVSGAGNTRQNVRARNNIIDLTGNNFVECNGVCAHDSRGNTSIGSFNGFYIEPQAGTINYDFTSVDDVFINCSYGIRGAAQLGASCARIHIIRPTIIVDPGTFGGGAIFIASGFAGTAWPEVVIKDPRMLMSDDSTDSTNQKIYVNHAGKVSVSGGFINSSHAYPIDISATSAACENVRSTAGVLLGYKLNTVATPQLAAIPTDSTGLVGPISAILSSVAIVSATLPTPSGATDGKIYFNGTHFYVGISSALVQIDNAGGGATNGYQEVSVSTAGNTASTQATAVHGVRITAAAGAGTYTRVFYIPVSSKSAGDICKVHIDFAASVNPTIEIRNDIAAGTLLWSWTGDGTATQAWVECEFDGSVWFLHASGFNQ